MDPTRLRGGMRWLFLIRRPLGLSRCETTFVFSNLQPYVIRLREEALASSPLGIIFKLFQYTVRLLHNFFYISQFCFIKTMFPCSQTRVLSNLYSSTTVYFLRLFHTIHNKFHPRHLKSPRAPKVFRMLDILQ